MRVLIINRISEHLCARSSFPKDYMRASLRDDWLVSYLHRFTLVYSGVLLQAAERDVERTLAKYLDAIERALYNGTAIAIVHVLLCHLIVSSISAPCSEINRHTRPCAESFTNIPKARISRYNRVPSDGGGGYEEECSTWSSMFPHLRSGLVLICSAYSTCMITLPSHM